MLDLTPERAERLKGFSAYVCLWRHMLPPRSPEQEARLALILPRLNAAPDDLTEEEAVWVVRHSRPRKRR